MWNALQSSALPVTWQEQSIRDYYNLQPSMVKGVANQGTLFHKRYLYRKIYSNLIFNLPDTIALNWFRFWLFNYGSIAIIYTSEFGWTAQPYGIVKLDINYNPSEITVFNQYFKSAKRGVIGVNSGIVKVFDDYYGLDDIVTNYAEMLAQIDRTINVNLMNSNVVMAFYAENKKDADVIKEAYGDATTGKPMVTLNKKFAEKPLAPFIQNIGQNHIVDRLLTERRTLVNNFLTEIGIRNANYEKKERLNSMEVSENNDETRAIISIIKDNIQESFDMLNHISDMNLRVRYRYDYNGGGEGNGTSDAVRDVSV